jgi:hypothetical protein
MRLHVDGSGGCDSSGIGGGFAFGANSHFEVSFTVPSPQLFLLSDNTDHDTPFQVFSSDGAYFVSLSCSLSSQQHGTVTMSQFNGSGSLSGTLYPGDIYSLTIVVSETGPSDPLGVYELVQDSFAFSVMPQPLVSVLKAVKPAFSNLMPTTNYILQVSSNMINWTNVGFPFPATSTNMTYPNYWDVDNWDKLFFRLQVSP